MAARPHEFKGAFGEPCVSEPCAGGELKEPMGVAVSEVTGEVYVVDKGEPSGAHGRVLRFDKAGTFQSEFTGTSATGIGTLIKVLATIGSALA
jgi:hypothetical protein